MLRVGLNFFSVLSCYYWRDAGADCCCCCYCCCLNFWVFLLSAAGNALTRRGGKTHRIAFDSQRRQDGETATPIRICAVFFQSFQFSLFCCCWTICWLASAGYIQKAELWLISRIFLSVFSFKFNDWGKVYF